MGDFEEKLQSILGDQRAMDQIMALARSLSGGEAPAGEAQNGKEEAQAPAPDAPPEPSALPELSALAGQLDPRMLQVGMEVMRQAQSAEDRSTALGGKSILLSHGHLWGVKSGYDRAIAQARAVGADILLFGHTHQALCCQLEDGLWMLNPGSSRSTYGLITLEEGTISCSVHHQN